MKETDNCHTVTVTIGHSELIVKQINNKSKQNRDVWFMDKEKKLIIIFHPGTKKKKKKKTKQNPSSH